jgi:uncharacterized protein YraI
MRHLTKPLLIAVVLAVVLAVLPAAVARSAPANTVTAKYALNVRSGPGTGYTVIGTLNAGATVPVTGRNASSTWLQIEHRPGASGWVAAWLVTPNGDIASLPVIGGGAPQPPVIPTTPVTTGRTTTSVNMRPEPNPYNTPIAVVPQGATVDVYGRNSAATWLYAGYVGKQGWVFASYVVLTSGTVHGLPIVGAGTPPSQPTPPVTPPATPVPPPTAFTPYIHNITSTSRNIFLDGQAKGNRAAVFSKIGDSITASWAFLGKIGDGVYNLNEYGYLQPTISYFVATHARTGNSFNNQSLAAVEGWSYYDLLDPIHVQNICPGLSPVACEYSYTKPSVAIIMIGTNDLHFGVTLEEYATGLNQIIDISANYGVIPVLSTIPHHFEGDAQRYNQIVVSTANARGVPWMDFYAATVNLPNHGNDLDGVHPAVPPTNDPTNFTQQNLQYGMTVRNLLTLHMLDTLWKQVLY